MTLVYILITGIVCAIAWRYVFARLNPAAESSFSSSAGSASPFPPASPVATDAAPSSPVPFSIILRDSQWSRHHVEEETIWSRIALWFAASRLALNDAYEDVHDTVADFLVAVFGPVEWEEGTACPVCERVCADVMPGAYPCSGPRVLAQCCVTLETVELTDDGECPHVNGSYHPTTNHRMKGSVRA